MKSISKHLCVSQLALFLAVSFLFCLGLYHYVQHALIQELDTHLENHASTLTQMLRINEDHDRHGDEHEHRREKRQKTPHTFDKLALDAFDSTSSYFIFDTNGNLITRSKQSTLDDVRSIPIRHPKDYSEKIISNLKSPSGQNFRYLYATFYPQLEDGDPSKKQWTIIVLRDRQDIISTMNTLLTGCIVLGILFVLISSALTILNVRNELSPLNRIATEVETLDSSNLSYRFDTHTLPQELATTAEKLNDLLDRLEKSFLRERSFSGSAAHELRTPLAELKAIAQVGAKWDPKKAQQDDISQYFKDTETIITRMESLIMALLTLIENDPENMEVNWSSIDLVEEISRELEKHKHNPAAQHFKLTPSKPVHVIADPGLLSGILTNIIRNALEYADKESNITCKISQQGETVQLHLSNRCTELNKEDISRMTDVFWRKDSSRSGSYHQGLGLNLAQTYAHCMNCQLQITYSDDHWISVTLDGLDSAT